MYYCGCRVSEVAQLKKANVFKDHIIIQGKGDKQDWSLSVKRFS